MMNNISKTLVTAFAVMAVSSAAHATNGGASAQGDVKVKIQSALTVQQVDVLDFGTVIPDGNQAGTVTVPATGGAATVTNVTQSVAGKAGSFSVNGGGSTNNSQYVVTVSPSTVALTSPSSTDTMDVSLKLSNGQTSQTRTLTSGHDTFKVGGTLQVGDDQDGGLYSGTYNVNVNYQ